MDQFILDNGDRYRALVRAFKPAPATSGNDPSDSIQASPDFTVCARIRPMLEDETSLGLSEGIFIRDHAQTVDVHQLKKAPIVPWAWAGGVGTLFSYGQTGSGKTFTVSALERHVAETLMDGSSLEGSRKIFICIIELAGQKAFDLLNARKPISILEDSFGTTQLAGAAEHHITDVAVFFHHIDAAALLRRTEATKKNDESSRSHAICRIRIENPSAPEADDGLLYLVDLAGSEAARDKDLHDAGRMKEAREINTSLSVLKDCIRGRALHDADSLAPGGGGKSSVKKPYIPFRQSTLTKTLKHVFDPASTRQCKTITIACVNPCVLDVGPTRNTLRYAELLRVSVPRPKAVEHDPAAPSTWNNEQMRAWIDSSSGTPPISSALLAPTESGRQLLHLSATSFVYRCLKTEGVSAEQANAFQAKFWRLHFDSLHRSGKAGVGAGAVSSPSSHTITNSSRSAEEPSSSMPDLSRQEKLDSSVDPEPGADAIPFKQRIRPGMVVSWSSSKSVVAAWGDGGFYSSVAAAAGIGMAKNYALILCPASAVGERVRDVRGVKVNGKEKEEGDGERYLCAMILPAIMPGAYSISMWRHVVVGVEQMEEEALLEFDNATRYYFLTV
ncbi:P-loop containing nucleoside triphosphate hydrolase protein [Bombardia bombarda]|uniref:P-loop containing nucleoside triphosphate hydrolase protein n=1 Tax=Bombardia bombarda TaxID=252184 RepID=A0AA40C4R8_9PEZI|nr:P-loop containing nucleoside triphosphate hydrolase protein [Bombardia bombarda]